MRDIVIVGALVLAFAVLFTVHVTITLSLARRTPRWRALVALVIAPVAPIWAWREHMHVRATIWVVALVAYATTRIIASV